MLAADLKLDAATVAVPTVHHHTVASELLDAGLDLLVEKPLAASLAEADDLIARAERSQRILQPGHLERFNPAVLAIQPQLATAYAWSADNKALTLKLRPGVTFHDGEPFDAAAVKFNIERHKTLAGSNRRGELAPVTTVDVLDPQSVMSALVNELDALAERLGCSAIRTMVLGQTSLAASGLYAAGHRPEGATLWKPIEETAPKRKTCNAG